MQIYSCIFRSILSLTLARARWLLCAFLYICWNGYYFAFFWYVPTFSFSSLSSFSFVRVALLSLFFPFVFSFFIFVLCFVFCVVFVSFCVLWFLVLLLHVKLLFIVVINFFSSFLLLNWVCECEYDTAIRLSYRAKVIWWYFFGCFCISAPKVWQPWAGTKHQCDATDAIFAEHKMGRTVCTVRVCVCMFFARSSIKIWQ